MSNLKEVVSYELTPVNGRKSFYGKCKVLSTPEGHKYLKSYGTTVATFTDDGTLEITKKESELTNTTLTHIRAFLVHIGKQPLTKQQILAL